MANLNETIGNLECEIIELRSLLNETIGNFEGEIIELRSLLKDVIETLTDRDDSVKDWIVEQLRGIEQTIDKDLK